MINLNIANISIVFLFVTSAISQIQDKIQIENTNNNKEIKNSQFLQISIAFVGLFLIIIEAIIWWKIRKERNMISFAVFTKDTISELPSQSNNVIDVKGEVISAEQAQQRDQSPVIKTIKQMTQDQSDESSRKKRKRKADRISDRRQKQVDQSGSQQ